MESERGGERTERSKGRNGKKKGGRKRERKTGRWRVKKLVWENEGEVK